MPCTRSLQFSCSAAFDANRFGALEQCGLLLAPPFSCKVLLVIPAVKYRPVKPRALGCLSK